ncbi:TadE/TadG family type IV pilus assembly protein [Laceyella putida]|uniref:TadE/TadG family type IV pilus assembly protein n=1 Tax=Laceyella putida TaxID=110101 RepID=A0ABW2RQM1_9BACL
MRRWREGRNKGSVTLEFIVVIPLVIFMCLFVAQFVVAGMAVLETQHFVKDGVRLAASSGKPKKEEERGKKEFGNSHNYWLSSYKVKIKDEQVVASADTKIRCIFLPIEPFTYHYSTKTPVIK